MLDFRLFTPVSSILFFLLFVVKFVYSKVNVPGLSTALKYYAHTAVIKFLANFFFSTADEHSLKTDIDYLAKTVSTQVWNCAMDLELFETTFETDPGVSY